MLHILPTSTIIVSIVILSLVTLTILRMISYSTKPEVLKKDSDYIE